MPTRIIDVTRRRIIRGLVGGSWSGDLDKVTFLERLFPLDELPSTGDRYTTVREDVIPHRVANYDQDDAWIFDGPRFGLATDDSVLPSFLAEMLHSEGRDDSARAGRVAASLTELLAHDVYEVVQVDDISGAPIFADRRDRRWRGWRHDEPHLRRRRPKTRDRARRRVEQRRSYRA